MIPDELSAQVQSAALEYFVGERQEMLLILEGSLLLTALALWFWFTTRTGFSAAFAITAIAAAVLFSGTAFSLLDRDQGLANSVLQTLGTENQAATLTAERERISVVLSKYPYYRYAAGVSAFIALLGLILSNRGWIHGVAAGLLIVVVGQVLIDHYSERRAEDYLCKLIFVSVPFSVATTTELQPKPAARRSRTVPPIPSKTPHVLAPDASSSVCDYLSAHRIRLLPPP